MLAPLAICCWIAWTAVPASGATHVVARNETLSAIAKKYGVSVNSLVEANNLQDKNHVERGQKLEIPVPRNPASTSTHVVQKGESLSAIARRYSVSVSAISRLNGISNPNNIRVGQKLKVPGAASSVPTTTTYTVRRGDELDNIARRFGVSRSSIVSLNNLSDANRIIVGQKLRIPGSGSVNSGPTLSSSLRNQLDAMRVSPGKWDYIVIHHSATPVGSPKGMDRHHREVRHMENGLAYHFVIGNGRGYGDGTIYVGNRWRKQINGGHLASERLNARSIGICLVGDFTRRGPSKEQMESLVALTSYLMDRCNVSKSKVQTHRQIHPNHTACPGNRFPVRSFLNQL